MSKKQVYLFGVNHKTTPVEVREKIAFTEGYESALIRLKNAVCCDEFYILSTCNRVEILIYGDEGAVVEEQLIDFLFAGKFTHEQARRYLYIFTGGDAVEHLFTVAASLDSMVVGEAQILGQLKTAYRYASQQGCTGPLLNRLLHKSFSVAKRVRTETAIGASAVSISYAAVQLARKIFGNLDTKKVMLLGAGEMAELAAEHLVGQGVSSVVVANRTLSRAVELAEKFSGEAIAMTEMHAHLADVDIIISSTGAEHIILAAADIQPLMRGRRNRPLFFIDIAVPRDLDPDLNDLENVYLYDIDDLSSVVEVNKSERDREAVKARCIVEEENKKFADWYQGLALKPTLLALRRKMAEIVEQELKRTLPRLGDVDEKDQQRIERMAASIGAKMLHDPLQYLKSDTCHGRAKLEAKADILRAIFALEE